MVKDLKRWANEKNQGKRRGSDLQTWVVTGLYQRNMGSTSGQLNIASVYTSKTWRNVQWVFYSDFTSKWVRITLFYETKPAWLVDMKSIWVVDFIFFKCSSSNSTHGMMIPPGGKNDHKVGIQPMTNENWEKLNWSLKSYGLATWQQWVCKAQEQESICMRTNRKKHVNVYGLCNLPNLGRSHAPWAPFRMTLCVEHLPLPEAQKPKG